MSDALHIPPHNIAAEQSVLGGLMLLNDAMLEISDVIESAHFYRRDHQIILEALRELSDSDRPMDIITVSDHLESIGKLDSVGGLAYIGTLVRNTPSAANIKTYAEMVRDCHTLRQMVRVGTDIAGNALDTGGQTVSDLLDQAQASILALGAQDLTRQEGFSGMRDLMRAHVDKIDSLYNNPGVITGLATGYADIDKMTTGLHPGELIIIAARPSHGKTSLAMNIAEYAAIEGKAAVAVFSMEMPKTQLMDRLASSVGRIDMQTMRTGKFDDEDWPKYTMAISLITAAKIFVDDSAALSPSQIRARARRLAKDQGGLGLIVIDYLQLMVGDRENDTRAGELDAISRQLKSLAKELSVPIIALAQLNRNIETRPDKRPRMSDLRDSGGIEQNADAIIFIYRDEVYNEDSDDKGTAEIIIGKQRNGPIGTLRLAWRGEYTRFENFSGRDYD